MVEDLYKHLEHPQKYVSLTLQPQRYQKHMASRRRSRGAKRRGKYFSV